MTNRRATVQRLMTVLAAFSLTLPVASAASAQTSAAATFSQMWMSWSETDIVRDEGLAPTGTAVVEQTLAGEKLRLFYALDAGDYPSPGDWSYFEHNAGAVYRASVTASTRLYVSGSAWWRANGDSWQAPDYRGLSAAANLEHQLRPTATLRAGLSARCAVVSRTDRDGPRAERLQRAEHGRAARLGALAMLEPGGVLHPGVPTESPQETGPVRGRAERRAGWLTGPTFTVSMSAPRSSTRSSGSTSA